VSRPNSPAELLDRGLKLSPESRYRFIMELLASLPPTEEVIAVERAFLRAELTRRVKAVEDGTMPTYTIEETMAYLRR
jgi:putative addiction module component (TIGR02574 family)